MKREDKELLLKDLCGRLPYGVKLQLYNGELDNDILNSIDAEEYIIINGKDDIETVNPYLFPLSSMTEEHREEINKITNGSVSISENFFYDLCSCSKIYHFDVIAVIDWLNANHFDYRGLIPKGLAIDCTNLNIY